MQILKIPNKILKTKCEDIPHVSIELLGQIEEMIQTAKDADLVGLAANQVGILQNFFVMNMGENWQAFINPVIKPNKEKGEKWGYEGCGSIPNIKCLVKRYKEINLIAQNTQGEKSNLILTGQNAIIAAHEVDHLNGILITSKAREIIRI